MLEDSETKVLAGILPKHTSRMERAQLRQINQYNFSHPQLRELWGLLDEYYDIYRAIMTVGYLKESCQLRGIDPTTTATMVEWYKVLAKVKVMDHEFDGAVALLKEAELSRKTEEIIVHAREIQQEGILDDDTGIMLRGQSAAREFLSQALRELETSGDEAAPEGDLKDDAESLWREYLDIKANPDALGGVKYGIEELDEYTGGIRPGELVLFAGFTGVGKSMFLASLAWNALLQNKNPLMFTTETTRKEMEQRIVARHTRLPQFGCPGGIDTHQIMTATLSPEHESVYQMALEDLHERDTGHLFMVQLPFSGSVEYVYTKAIQYNRMAELSLLCIDSINLLRPNRRFSSKREMLDEMLPEFKRFASAFDNGRGIGIASPWQMSRDAWKLAKEAGGVYEMASLSDTSEAEKGQPFSSGVLTPTGYREMGTLEVGDQIIDVRGEVQSVQQIHELGTRNIYRIHLNDEEIVECTPGHLWTVYSESEGLYKDVTAQDMLDSGEEYIIPLLTGAPNLSEEPLPETFPHPYLLGRMLNGGDNFYAPGQVSFTTKYPELLAKMMFSSPDYALRSVGTPEEMTFTYTVNGALEDYEHTPMLMASGLLSGDPGSYYISSIYMNAKASYREALLRGILDRPAGDIEYSLLPCSHPGIGPQVKWLALSLGIFDPEWGDYRKIVKVEDTGREEMARCITVSDRSGLYITDGFVVTHNSASQIITLFAGDDDRLYIQAPKIRGAAQMPPIAYPRDFRNSYIGPRGDAGDTSAAHSTGGKRDISSMLDFKNLEF